MNEGLKASIVIRTYNEGRHIERLMLGIREQEAPFGYEVILVDSGSTDDTVGIAEGFGAKIVRIPPERFSFGYALNKGIEGTRGDYCVTISGHCYPGNNLWLRNLIRPFEDSSVAVVYGKQRGNHMTKYSEHQIFIKWFPEDEGGKQDSAFCNNANAAIRKSLWDVQKYDEAITGLEDIDLAKRAMATGYHVYYAPDALAVHVHDESYPQIYRRHEREAIALRHIYPAEGFSFFDFVKLFMLNTLSDYAHALREGVFIKNIIGIPAMRLFQFWGTYKGLNYRRPVTSKLKQKFYYPRRPAIYKGREE